MTLAAAIGGLGFGIWLSNQAKLKEAKPTGEKPDLPPEDEEEALVNFLEEPPQTWETPQESLEAVPPEPADGLPKLQLDFEEHPEPFAPIPLETTPTDTCTQEDEEPEAIEYTDDAFPLKLGSKGPRVTRLKVWIMRNHGGAGVITDEFDPQTLKRVQRHFKADQVSKKVFTKHRMGKHVQEQKTMQ